MTQVASNLGAIHMDKGITSYFSKTRDHMRVPAIPTAPDALTWSPVAEVAARNDGHSSLRTLPLNARHRNPFGHQTHINDGKHGTELATAVLIPDTATGGETRAATNP